jgi:hypothetical protein
MEMRRYKPCVTSTPQICLLLIGISERVKVRRNALYENLAQVIAADFKNRLRVDTNPETCVVATTWVQT